MIDAFLEVVNFIFGLLLVAVAAVFAYMSCVMVSEKKARYRAGTHDYYDNPINRKCMGGEDETLGRESTSAESTKTAATKTGVFDKSKVKYFDGDNT